MKISCLHRTEHRDSRLPNALWKPCRSCPHHRLPDVAQATSLTAKAMDGLHPEEQVHGLEQGVSARGPVLATGTRAQIHFLADHLAGPDRAQGHQRTLQPHSGHRQLHIDLLYLLCGEPLQSRRASETASTTLGLQARHNRSPKLGSLAYGRCHHTALCQPLASLVFLHLLLQSTKQHPSTVQRLSAADHYKREPPR